MQQRSIATLSLFLAILSIQLGASIAKQIFPAVGPGGITLLRLWIAMFLLLAIWRPWRQWRLICDRSPALSLIFYGLSLGGMNLLFYLALARIPLGVAVALEFVGPLGVALFASRRWMDFVWAGLAATGIFLLMPSVFSENSVSTMSALDPIGVALALGAGVFWALYIIFGRRVGHSIPSGQATALGMVVAALLVLPFGVHDLMTAPLSSEIMLLAGLVAILSSALPYTLEMFALRRIPARTFGILLSLEPAVAALLGLGRLNEELTLLQWGAVGCIVLASLATTSERDLY